MKTFLTKKINLQPASFTALLSIILVAFYNGPFWSALSLAQNDTAVNNIAFLGTIGILLLIAFNAILTLIAYPRILKAVAIIIIIVSGISLYFMDRYHIFIDASMVHNVMATDLREVKDLLSVDFFFHVLIYICIPISIILINVQLVKTSVWRQFIRNAITIIVSLLCIGFIALFFYKECAFTFRNNQQLSLLLNPTNSFAGIFKYVRHTTTSTKITPIGLDATQVKQDYAKRNITVVVVGETARAQNFSLFGYTRNTNPLLSKQNDIIAFSNVSSCGTATVVSLPCMFSHLSRKDFSLKEARAYENIVDILKRSGIYVYWRNNNSGCKDVCNRIAFEDMSRLSDLKLCNTEECYDEILLQDLDMVLAKTTKDTVIILHQKGSHGPTYHKRVPQKFKIFTPECSRSDLQTCDTESVINSYDNTILYTDYFLDQVLIKLKQLSKNHNTALIYASDHGESLGEKGLYLHGVPYMFAPKEQTHIPMILWLSDGFKKSLNLNITCLKNKADAKLSHDNLFHTLLSMNNVKTNLYAPELDLFFGCTGSTEIK